MSSESGQAQWIPLIATLIGGILTIIGGFAANIFKLRAERKQEVDYIKIGLIDELEDIVSVIGKMLETYKTSKTIPMVYFNNLTENTKSFDDHRPRLFLIADKEVRRQIYDFYKELKEELEGAKISVGSLNPEETEAQNDVANKVTNKFTNIQTKATILKNNIEEI